MSWSRFRTEALTCVALVALTACAAAPPVVDAPASDESRTEPAATAPETEPASPGAAAAAPPVEVPPRAAQEFARAVELMRAGNVRDAELEFAQLAAAYPQLAGPHVNLGLLHRKAGQLDAAVDALRAAVERSPANAVAWNELGVTLRMRGNFQDAAAAYERALAADATFAAAWRNLGVLRDLYLGDAAGALECFEKYQSLTGEERPVNGWIAELRQRTGIKAPQPAAAESTPAEPPPQSGARN